MRAILKKISFRKDEKINILWLLGDHLITFVGGFFIGIWLARYLGPNKFGNYSYALALLSIASSLAHLGLGGIAVKDFVESKNINESLSSVGLLKLLGSVFGFTMLLIYLYIYSNDPELYLMASIIGVGILFTPISIIDNYFDSVVLSKYKVLARKSGYIFKSLMVIIFILYEWPFEWLAYIILTEYIVGSAFLVFSYIKIAPKFEFYYSIKKIKSLLVESWPLIISGFGAMLYLKMDQIMIVSMVGGEAGGHYAAAVRYTSIFYFLHSIIITTFFPSLISKKKESEHSYQFAIKQLTSGLLYLSLFIVLGTYLFISPFIMYTFGEEYIASVEIIKYHIWSLPLVFLGAVLSKWLIMEKLTKFSILRHTMGLVANLSLNLLLIPKYGAVGAAIASIFALIFAVLIVLVFHPRLRLLASLFIKSSIPNLVFQKKA